MSNETMKMEYIRLYLMMVVIYLHVIIMARKRFRVNLHSIVT